jgi:Zn-dependent peptidase ImmA (M78 family)
VQGKNYSRIVERLLSEVGIIEPPVDVDRIATTLNISVAYAKMADSLSGFLSTRGNKRVVGINARHHRNRQRFTLAHEIAHVLLEHDTGDVHVDKGIVLYRNTDSAVRSARIEVDANRLAAELLIPKQMLKDDLSELDAFDAITDDDIESLASRYEISISALLNRLGDIGFATVRHDLSYESAAADDP